MKRPQALAEVAERADNLTHFGHEFADWLHTVRNAHHRPKLIQSIRDEPPLLRGRFPEGAIADAWLAAYAEFTADRIGTTPPQWVRSADRIAPEPWFSVDGKRSRLLALRDSPPAFKNRNLFTPKVDLPLRLRAGRPPVSDEHKRRKNADRQRRFRQRQAEELKRLRDLIGKSSGES
ncbi:MAG: hypothetical protein SynsKO_03060 [Synoicihabitans sp.]